MTISKKLVSRRILLQQGILITDFSKVLRSFGMRLSRESHKTLLCRRMCSLPDESKRTKQSVLQNHKPVFRKECVATDAFFPECQEHLRERPIEGTA